LKSKDIRCNPQFFAKKQREGTTSDATVGEGDGVVPAVEENGVVAMQIGS
jgi:hypothetical protein